MIGAFLGWEAVLFCLVAGSVQGLVVAGIGMATGTALIPKRPDADVTDDPTPSSQGSEDPVSSRNEGTDAEDDAREGPTMMVFGPMLALSAIEYLLFGPDLVARGLHVLAN